MDVIDTLRTFLCTLRDVFDRLVDLLGHGVHLRCGSRGFLHARCKLLCGRGDPFHLAVDLVHVFLDGGDMGAQGDRIVLHTSEVSGKCITDLRESCRKVSNAVFSL